MMETDWLSDLEKKVELAAAELKALRKENTTQQTKIERLEKQVSESKATNQSSGVWEKDREQIRKRVEKLASGLEKLL